MIREEILAKVIELVAKHGGVEASTVTAATHLVNDLGFDSLTAVEFTMEVEEEFELSIPDEVAQQLQTVEQVVEHLAAHIKADSREKAEG